MGISREEGIKHLVRANRLLEVKFVNILLKIMGKVSHVI